MEEKSTTSKTNKYFRVFQKVINAMEKTRARKGMTVWELRDAVFNRVMREDVMEKVMFE